MAMTEVEFHGLCSTSARMRRSTHNEVKNTWTTSSELGLHIIRGIHVIVRVNVVASEDFSSTSHF